MFPSCNKCAECVGFLIIMVSKLEGEIHFAKQHVSMIVVMMDTVISEVLSGCTAVALPWRDPHGICVHVTIQVIATCRTDPKKLNITSTSRKKLPKPRVTHDQTAGIIFPCTGEARPF